MNKSASFFAKPFFSDKRLIAVLWFTMALIASSKHIFSGNFNNNYIIYKYVFLHTLEQVNLYASSPFYFDTNYYGPVFSLIIAPFALLPDYIGCVLWGLCIALSLFVAFHQLPLDWKMKVPLFYITLQELFSSIQHMQTNTLIAALIIGSFIAIRREKDGWAACFIVLGFLIKLYGIAGLSFFFFSKHKGKLIFYLMLWMVIFFILPMFISSPQFIIQSYMDWFQSLITKNTENAASIFQDISVMGMIRRISGNREISLLIVLLPAMLIFGLQYLRINLYKDTWYQLGILASTLLFVVLFSSSSESPTYIIAMSGVAIWFIIQKEPRSQYIIYLLIFAIVVTSFSPSDFIPRVAREFIRQYALKALPCLLIWLTLVYQLIYSNKGFRVKE